jgi:hypothetical protein
MRCLAFALLICGTAAAQTAAMYRTVSPDGTVTFSDVPLSENSEVITVLVRSGTTRSAEPAAQESVSSDESIAAEMAENCDRAREQQRSLANSTRLYRVLPSGERQFLSDEEIADAREQAAADVAQWCQQAG